MVLPWNFFQSKSAALAAVVMAPSATAIAATRVANAFLDMRFSLLRPPRLVCQIDLVTGYTLRSELALSSRPTLDA